MRGTTLLGILLLAAAVPPAEARLGSPSRLPPGPSRQSPLPSSNMGFRVDVELSADAGGDDLEIVALPLQLGTGDVADASAAEPCSEAGAPRADGVEDALDLLCTLWTSREGGLWISRRSPSGPGWESRGIWRLPGGGFAHAGDWLAPITSGEAVSARILAPAGSAVTNRSVVVGSHDGSAPCPVYAGAPLGPANGLLNVFYHSMARSADDLLCGLQGLDWVDADADGAPDTCNVALFDSGAGGSALVADFTSSTVTLRSVRADASAPHGLRFEGTNFPLTVTRGQAVVLSPEQTPRTWCQPHF